MSFGLNRAEIIGRLGADVTVNHLANGGRVANLSIATDEGYIDKNSGERRDRTEWHRVATFQDGLVAMLEKHARKGRLVYVAGKLQTRRWRKEGEDTDRFSIEILLVPSGRCDKPAIHSYRSSVSSYTMPQDTTGESLMLKIIAATVACSLTLSACSAVDALQEEQFRTHHLRFSEDEYQKYPGVLMRASLHAWGAYNEEAKVAAVVDYYADPEGRLKPENFRYRIGTSLEKILGGALTNVKKPQPRKLKREDALKRIHCMDDLSKKLSERTIGIPSFAIEARCNAFLSRNSVPMECVSWEISTKRERWGDGYFDKWTGYLVNTCAP